METIWIEPKKLERALARNEAFWRGELEEYPLMWVTAPSARAAPPPAEPATEPKFSAIWAIPETWTDVGYVIESAEHQLAHTHYAGDSLPVYHPWLGPDQFAAWLGAEIIFRPKDSTSWVKPFVDDPEELANMQIDPDNQWWKLYLELLHRSVQAGKGKWVTAYPDLHTGLDALCAMRGPENLMMDTVSHPDLIHRAMKKMTELWKYVVDSVSDIVLPVGQGTSNWSMGWSEDRYLCMGQNDSSCMISPEMFVDFCLEDNVQCCSHVDHSLYHLDGPGALQHVPTILELENLTAVQWIEGAGNPCPSEWLDLLFRIQQAGKSVQVLYGPGHGDQVDLIKETEILCRGLDQTKLCIWIFAHTVEEAEAIIQCARRTCRSKH